MIEDHRPRLPQFSLKDFLLATILIGNGIGMLSMLATYSDPSAKFDMRMLLPPPCLWFLGGMSLGAGIFAVFRKPQQGALWGLAFQVALLLLLFLFGHGL